MLGARHVACFGLEPPWDWRRVQVVIHDDRRYLAGFGAGHRRTELRYKVRRRLSTGAISGTLYFYRYIPSRGRFEKIHGSWYLRGMAPLAPSRGRMYSSPEARTPARPWTEVVIYCYNLTGHEHLA